jgi:hypothetical protein
MIPVRSPVMIARIGQDESEPKQKVSYYKALHDIANQIHAAEDINEILINLKGEILSFFDADRITIYVVDGKAKEIYSRFSAGSAHQEIRLPINNQSVAGYTANNAQIISIVNAYDDKELKSISKELTFDRSWDERSGYATRQILAVPISYTKYVVGVLQLINKKSGHRFSDEDQNSAVEMAKVLGIAFFNQKKMAQKKPKRTKFDYLIDNNIISEKELETAISTARDKRLPIENVFIQDLKVRKDDVGRSIASYYHCEYVPFNTNFPIPGELLARLKSAYLRNNLWVPLSGEGGKIKILIDNPQRLDKIDSIKSLLPAEKYEFAVGLRDDILQFLDYFYETHRAGGKGSIDDILNKMDLEDLEESDGGAEMLTENDSIIVQLVNKIITDAHQKKQLRYSYRALSRKGGGRGSPENRRHLPEIPDRPLPLSAGSGFAYQDYGRSRYFGKKKTAGRQNQVQEIRWTQYRGEDRHDSNRRRGRRRYHADSGLCRAPAP